METVATADLEDRKEQAQIHITRKAWRMVLFSMLGTMCCSTSVVLINTGVFIKPLADAFGWSRGDIVLSLSIAAIAMAAANPFVGRLMDHFGVRPILFLSLLGYGGVTAALPFLVKTGDIQGLYLAYILIGVIGAGSNVMAYVRILSGWFSGPMERSRGLALGISSAGVALGAAVVGPFALLLISHFDWQTGFFGLALLPILVGLPIAVFLLRMAPGDEGGSRSRQTKGREQLAGHSVSEAIQLRAFWLLLGSVLLMSGCLQGVMIHLAPILSDLGLSPETTAFILLISGILTIVGRVLAGFLFDHFFAPYVSMAIFFVGAASMLLYAGFTNATVAILATLAISIGNGTESDFIGYVVGRYFGLRAYAEIFGIIYGMFMIGIALGPYLFGLAFDHLGSYRISFAIAGGGLCLLCALLMLLPRFPQRAS